jgi:hypothetical protein
LGQLEENPFEKARRVKESCAVEFFFFFLSQATRLIRKRYLVPYTSTCLVCKRKERTLIPVLGLDTRPSLVTVLGQFINTFKNNLQFQSQKNKLERFWSQFRS